jgi:hypothetical protein
MFCTRAGLIERGDRALVPAVRSLVSTVESQEDE